jgi:hypothetical protein
MGSRTNVGLAILWVGLLAGCQPSAAEMGHQLTVRMSMIDFSGLAPAVPLGGGLDVSAAIPRAWQLAPGQERAMFAHQQWRNAARDIGVGVVHVHMPLPMSAKTLVWLAKSRYAAAAKSSDGGKPKVPGGEGQLLNEWTDAVGREWVEAENDRVHVKGYAVTCGFDAWIVYVGVRRPGVPNPVDLQLAERSMESVVPGPLAAAMAEN